MRCICWKHQTITAWGCQECRAEELDKITQAAIAKMEMHIRRMFEKIPDQQSDGGSHDPACNNS